MAAWLVIPPVVFLVVFVFVFFVERAMSLLAPNPRARTALDKNAPGAGLPPTAAAQLDYRRFFPFAYLFTIMQTAALVIATLPPGSRSAAEFAVLYLGGTAIALFILLRR